MPEISEQEWSELKAQVANLSTQMNATRNRIQDLEDFASDHLGLDWGESLVDANSPHPNISVNTIESGGGKVRQDIYGTQVATGNGETGTAIYFVQGLLPDPSTATERSELLGEVSNSDHATTKLRARAASGSVLPTVVAHAQADGYGYVAIQNAPLMYSSVISPSQITANQNDYNPTDLPTAGVLRLSTDASRDITGITAVFGGIVLLILNVGSFDIVLKNESASSTAANRFSVGADITLGAGEGCWLWYDVTDSRWRCPGKHV